MPQMPNSTYEGFDEKFLFEHTLAAPLQKLPYFVQNATVAGQMLNSDSPKEGDTDRLVTNKAEPMKIGVRYNKFDFKV
jgi:hypothetical protein